MDAKKKINLLFTRYNDIYRADRSTWYYAAARFTRDSFETVNSLISRAFSPHNFTTHKERRNAIKGVRLLQERKKSSPFDPLLPYHFYYSRRNTSRSTIAPTDGIEELPVPLNCQKNKIGVIYNVVFVSCGKPHYSPCLMFVSMTFLFGIYVRRASNNMKLL